MPARRAGLCCTARASRPASAVGVSSNVRPHNFIFQRSWHQPSSLCSAYFFLPRAQKQQVNSRKATTTRSSSCERLGPTGVGLLPSSGQRSAEVGSRMDKHGHGQFVAPPPSRKPPLGKLGHRLRGKPETKVIEPGRGTVRQTFSFAAPGFAVRPNNVVEPGPATAGVVSPVRACRGMVADRAYNACRSGPG